MLRDSVRIQIKLAVSDADQQAVQHLRHVVYVADQGRLDATDQMVDSFDRFTEASYLVAWAGDRPVGTVKVVNDSTQGLPCEQGVEIDLPRGAGRRFVEFGHLLTHPEVRDQGIGIALMGAALRHAVEHHEATHVLGDFFVDENGELRDFYTKMGFTPVGPAYRDERFSGAPWSTVAVIEVAAARRVAATDPGRAGEVLRQILGDALVPEASTAPVSTPREASDPGVRGELARIKAEHNHPVYARLEYLMGCSVQGPGSGATVIDERGAQFTLLFDQYGNQAFGMAHDGILKSIRDQLDSGRLNSVKSMFEEESIMLAQALSDLTGGALPYSSLTNSGAEAIETAVKVARAATGRLKVVATRNAFHGKTLLALSASGRPEHRELLGELAPHFEQVGFGDLAELEAALDDTTAAVLLEPIQAEGGIIPATPDYLAEVRRLCDRHGALLILDEMQTAFGRTGSFFAYEHFGVQPDLVCLGKALGGGIVPVSAVLARPEVWDSYTAVPSAFGSSLGGNPLCSAVAIEAIKIGSDPAFLSGVGVREKAITEALAGLAATYPELIREHRGLGLMHGIEFTSVAVAGTVLATLYERRVLTAFALYSPQVLRVQPPLTIPLDQLASSLRVLEEVLADLAAARDSATERSTPPGTTSVVLRLPFPHSSVAALLASEPRALDPFAAEGAADAASHVLLDEPVGWEDQCRTGEDGIEIGIVSSWLWKQLDRSFHLSGDERQTTIDVSIRWNAGLGELEPMYDSRLRNWIAERIDTKAELLARKLDTSMETVA